MAVTLRDIGRWERGLNNPLERSERTDRVFANLLFTLLFQLHSFRYVDFESSLTKHGPFSSSSPMRDEPPGPPLSQMANGALWGSFLASKNQKNLLEK